MTNGTIAPSMRPMVDGRHVLIVDDVALDGFLASAILRQEGYEVTLATDGTEAIDAVAGADFDLVLMDVRMPGMDGLEATRQIRKLEGRSGRVPIVALSGLDFGEQQERFLSAGMDGVMSKPFDLETLRATLSHVKQIQPANLNKRRSGLKALSEDEITGLFKTRKETDRLVTLSRKELSHKLYKWAGFSMETAFWTQLEHICSTEKTSPREFIEDARRLRPNIALSLAVRLLIISYFRSRGSSYDT